MPSQASPPSERRQRNVVCPADVAPAQEIRRRRSRASTSVPGPPPTAAVAWRRPPTRGAACVEDWARPAEQRVDADDREADHEHAGDPEDDPRRREPDAREAGEED